MKSDGFMEIQYEIVGFHGFQSFLIFRWIFEALRGVSGSSFALEGICKIFWTNQKSASESRELSGTYSIWGYKIIVLLVFPFVSKPKLEPVPGNSRHCSANICFIQKILRIPLAGKLFPEMALSASRMHLKEQNNSKNLKFQYFGSTYQLGSPKPKHFE